MRLLSIALISLITGCATAQNSQLGWNEYKKGNHAAASKYYVQCANAGELVCMNNLGMIQYRAGHKEIGLGWINAAAARGHEGAIQNLKNFNLPIPEQVSKNSASDNEQRNRNYKSSFGNEYQYDLSKPSDQLKYELDLKAQMRDELDIDPRRELERDLLQNGGGKLY
jgi:hypothetical protein